MTMRIAFSSADLRVHTLDIIHSPNPDDSEGKPSVERLKATFTVTYDDDNKDVLTISGNNIRSKTLEGDLARHYLDAIRRPAEGFGHHLGALGALLQQVSTGTAKSTRTRIPPSGVTSRAPVDTDADKKIS